MDNDIFYRNLVNLLKIFNNRPYHLAKYLIENSALNDYFIKNINNSKGLTEMNEDSINFNSIIEMENFYSSLLNTEEIDNRTIKDLEEILERLIKEERYEEASNLRDYIRSKIKTKK